MHRLPVIVAFVLSLMAGIIFVIGFVGYDPVVISLPMQQDEP